jgi:hypothetical protein
MIKNNNHNQGTITGPKKTVSVKAVIGYMGFLFAIFVTFMVWFRYSNFSPLADWYDKGITIQKVDIRSLFNSKVTSGSTVTGNIELKITEQQIIDAAGVDKTSFPLKKAKLKVVPAGIEIEGKMSDKIWDFMMVKITLKPVVKDDAVSFDIEKIEASGVQAPPKITDLITPKIDYIFANLLPKDKLFKVTQVYAMQGFLLIDGEKVVVAVPAS